MGEMGGLGGKPLADSSSTLGKGRLGLQAEKPVLIPLELVQPLGGENAQNEKAHISAKGILCDRHLISLILQHNHQRYRLAFLFFAREEK